MLAYVLALVVGLSSFALYMAAFFFPEVHRRNDFIWSGVGLFYALVLWVCAGRITGGVLLGQMASVALLGWFGWQTLTLRRLLAAPEQQTEIPSQAELQEKLKNVLPAGGLQGLQGRVTNLFRKGKPEAKPTQTAVDAKIADVIAKEAIKAELDEVAATVATPEESTAELVRPNPPDPKLVESAQKEGFPESAASGEQIETPVEEIAPEIELAPPAEPKGAGDPEDRKAEL